MKLHTKSEYFLTLVTTLRQFLSSFYFHFCFNLDVRRQKPQRQLISRMLLAFLKINFADLLEKKQTFENLFVITCLNVSRIPFLILIFVHIFLQSFVSSTGFTFNQNRKKFYKARESKQIFTAGRKLCKCKGKKI